MSFTFDDESRLWAIFDTCTKPHYYQDVHNLLAAPQGWVLRYEYRKQCRRSPKPAVFLLAREGLIIIRAEGASGLTS